ncbi:MAG: CusA/CzcA family heavy metal efflux RND transporter [Hylemonella sp.]|uniref:efflux RND transporter permease subunit n=1 Tax=Hylemonella sp. TaxID=2066020 RepID=UPI0022BBD8C5|nr:CusA/CzcA family heavy metal efflux RND transporter [Hylemonella sp.]MCZ8250985.1 CusA/CzcA family heavy metal efflux RND transporter [Hylemonella sp.]
MIAALIRWSLQERILVAVICVVMLIAGGFAVKRLSVDAFPDVTNVQVQVATEAPGRPPTEVERFVTVPIEISMTGLPGLVEMRSLNRNGLSLITLVFTDKTDVYFARQLVLERLVEVTQRLPAGVTPVLGPVSTGLGEVYQYTLERKDDRDAQGRLKPLSEEELRSRREVQDWVVRPMLRSIAGVADINSQGGYARQYQVKVNPDRLRYYGLSVKEVYEAVARNNANSSGGVLPALAEQYLIRGVGLIASLEDVGNIALKEFQGTPVYVKDVASVAFGSEVRQGAIIKDGETEAVAGIVQMIRGGNAREVVTRIKARVKEINEKQMLPDGLQIVPFYDRSDLVNTAMVTVAKVLAEGIILVVIILFVFLGDVRSSIIVVATLVLTPLLTFFVMNRIGLSANLMSLGGLAIAIGLMVDGAVVVVENAFARLGDPANAGKSKPRVILEAASEVGKPVLYGVGIIILVFLPLLSLQGMEGKMFAPLALTIAIALTISLILSFTMSPVLCSYILKGGAEHDTWLLRKMKEPYLRMLHWALAQPKKVFMGAMLALVGSFALVPFLGTAFIPTMQEGSITPVIVRVPKISIEESIKLETQAMRAIKTVPEVHAVVSRLGRGESASDPGQPHESDPIVMLKPRDEWRDGMNQEDIANEIRDKLKFLPGVEIAISQPIAARVDEMVSGVRSQVAVKIFGDDLDQLRKLGDAVAGALMATQGATDLRVERVSGQEYLTIQIDRSAIARYGINVEDVNALIEIAVQGRVATQVYEGERRFDTIVRLPAQFRSDVESIGNLVLRAPTGAIVPLRDVADITLGDGPAQVSREGGKRRLVIGVNVQGRDLGGFVAEAQSRIDRSVPLPAGYYLSWGGQFENMERAIGTLSIIIPITITAIFFLLFMLFNSVRYAALVITVLPLAAIGGLVALAISGEYLSVPAAVGFINLWGIAVLNGVVLVSFIRQQREAGLGTDEAIIEGCTHRFRPVMMTAMVALLALIPMLFSTGPGSEVTRPLAVVVIGGLFSSTSLTLLLVPVLYRWFEEKEIEA